MQLSAQQRYATLQIMGTRLWVPRVSLQGAAPSKICDWPLPPKPMSARERLFQQQAKTAVTPAPVTPVAPIPVAVIPTPAMPAAPAIFAAPASAVQQQPLVNQAIQAAQPLQVIIWLLANGWQLVMEMPVMDTAAGITIGMNIGANVAATGLQEIDVKLLHNLLVALYPGGLGVVNQQVFNWPLQGVPVAAGDEGELSMTLQAFLTGARFQEVQLAGCLVFGERLFKLMEKNTHLLPRLFSSPTLLELQRNPLAKQAFWQQAGNSGLRAAFASSPVML